MSTYNETEDQFFDSRVEISSVSDSASDDSDFCSDSGREDFTFGYEFWTRKLEGVNERRSNFFKWMRLGLEWDRDNGVELADIFTHYPKIGMDIMERLKNDGDAVLANSDSENKFLSAQSSGSFQPNETVEMVNDADAGKIHSRKIRNLDDGTEFLIDGLGKLLRVVGSNRVFSIDEFQRSFRASSLVQRFLRRDSDIADMNKKVKKGWLQKLSTMAQNADVAKVVNSKSNEIKSKITATTQKYRYHSYRKRSKELSLLQEGQQFPAHKGSILTMKFSPDGQYLASGGEDGVLRVWKVIEDEYHPDALGIKDSDTSCMSFSLDQFSELAPININTEKIARMKTWRKSSEYECVVLPPKVFRISEKPVHEFCRHKGEVLSLSWSKNGYLVSSSTDKTACLWQVGVDECLGVYTHNNYVTCVEFNPVDDDYFISGSIDGKVRIWKVHDFRVIDWIDVREIVTAVCYSPDGKSSIVGTIDGNCRFYDVVDNCLQLGSHICLEGKKKFAGKRITGFQFCPGDMSKVMVSSADSQVRILSGSNVICKFKGVRNPGSHVPASFTADGKHVISITEDSNVYLWNYTQEQKTVGATNVRSRESFWSQNASIAVPWGGLKTKTGALNGAITENGCVEENLLPKMPSSLPDCFALGRGFFLDSLLKASATWPEEKLPDQCSTAVPSHSLCKSEFKFLKTALQNALSAPNLWGLVIVTAGWDGCIKTFLNYGLPVRF